MKFCLETSKSEHDWNEKILPALKVYRPIHHHCIVEVAFEVPRESPWPEEAWGIRLGKVVNQIRVGANYVECAVRDEKTLKKMGFVWDRKAAIWNDQIIPALQAYFAEFNTCQMPTTFAVPACEPWPKSAWNMALGRQVYRMRKNGCSFSFIGREVDRLKDLGFRLELSRQAWDKLVGPLLEIYESCFGDMEVPHEFVIPSEAPWPKKMWGVHLGVFVASNAWGRE